jgi:hypothetical protein
MLQKGPERANTSLTGALWICLANNLEERQALINRARRLKEECIQLIADASGILPESKAVFEASIPDQWRTAASELSRSDSLTAPTRIPREKASERRTRELRELITNGFPILRVGKWQFRVGPLCIWPYSGRWLNAETGARGKLNSISMKDLIQCEIGELPTPSPISGAHADGSGEENYVKLEARYSEALQTFLTEAEKLSEMLEQFRADHRTTVGYLRLSEQRNRETAAYGEYRRLLKQLLDAGRSLPRVSRPAFRKAGV